MAAKLEEITATLGRVLFPRGGIPDDDFEGFVIAACRTPDGEQVTVKGEVAAREFVPGVQYRFYGRAETHEKYGPQFAFQTHVMAVPHERGGVIRYLCDAPGVGRAIAEQLWNKFRGDAVRVLRETPEIAAAAVKPLAEDKALQAAEHLDRLQAVEDCTIELTNLLSGRGFPRQTIRRAIHRWGNKATEILQRDPFKLLSFKGVGFPKSDAMYLDLGLPPARLKRQAACLMYAVSSDRQGHVWIPLEAAVQELRGKLSSAQCKPERALQLATRSKRLSVHKPHENGRAGVFLAERHKADAEDYVARKLTQAMGEESHWPDVAGVPALTDHQREQISLATLHAVGILGGSPGVGKTYSAAALIKAIISEHGASSVIVSAPTGKAAVRCNQAMAEYGLPVSARTIHSTLGVESFEGGIWEFRHGERNPLPARFWIIDETSMMGCYMLSLVLAARARGCNLLFVGDVNQLPPVEYGAPLRDMIAAGLPYGELTEIHRNAGTIVRACHQIRQSVPFTTDDEIDVAAQPPRNLQWIPAGKFNALQAIVKLVRAIRDAGRFDPVWDTQVVVAVNAKSSVSRKAVNEALQAELNPSPDGQQAGVPFRVDDKVICLENTAFSLVGEADEQVPVRNGEFGRVLKIEGKRAFVRFFDPDRKCIVPFGTRRRNDDDGNEKEGGALSAIDLSYAVTVHKCQGSSAPVVIVAVDEYPGATGPHGICDRAWLYTAISRAEKVCYLVGKPDTARVMCRQQYIDRRRTRMTELIRTYRSEAAMDAYDTAGCAVGVGNGVVVETGEFDLSEF